MVGCWLSLMAVRLDTVMYLYNKELDTVYIDMCVYVYFLIQMEVYNLNQMHDGEITPGKFTIPSSHEKVCVCVCVCVCVSLSEKYLVLEVSLIICLLSLCWIYLSHLMEVF